jgi:hypothetical protein
MINVSEHVNRPHDMLMFLGEYFKEHIKRCIKVEEAVKKNSTDQSKELDKYFITHDILN